MSSPVNNAASIDIAKLKVNELKAELMVRGLDSKGLKSALVERLRAALEAEGKGTSVSTSEMSANQAATAAEVAANESTDLLSMSDENICGSDDNNASLAANVTTTVNDFSEIDKEIIGNDESQYMSAEDDVSIVKKEVKPDASELQTQMDVEVKATIFNEMKREISDDSGETETNQNQSVNVKKELKKEIKDEIKEQSQQNQSRNASQNNRRNYGKKRYDPEFEPELNEDAIALSWSDSDIHLDINRESFLEAKPYIGQVNGFLWSSARGTHGIRTGKVYYQVTITDRIHWRDIWAYRANDKSNGSSGKHGREDDAQQQDATTKKSKMDEGVATSEVADEKNIDAQKSEAQIAIEKQVAEEGIDYSQDADINQLEKEQKEAAVETQQQQQMQVDNEDGKENGEGESSNVDESLNALNGTIKQENVTEPVVELTPEEKEAKRVAGTTHALRVGFSVLGTNLVVGDDHLSFAYDTVGYSATDSEYTVCRVPGLKETPEVGDTLTVFLDCGDETSDSIRMYVTYNTEEIVEDNLVFNVKKSELVASAARKFAAEKERFETERVRQNMLFKQQVKLEQEEREERKQKKIQTAEANKATAISSEEQKMTGVETEGAVDVATEGVTACETEKTTEDRSQSIETNADDNKMVVESTSNEAQESTNDVAMTEPAEAEEEKDEDQYLKSEMDVEDDWTFVQPDLILFPHISSRNFAFKVKFGGPKAKKVVPVEAPKTTATVSDNSEGAVAETTSTTNGDTEMTTTATESDVQIVEKDKVEEEVVKESELEVIDRVIDGYEMIGNSKEKKSNGIVKMASRADCEVVLLIGMPGCGKTTWAQRYMRSEKNKHRPFYVLGKDQLVMRTKINGIPKAYINDYQLDRCVNSLVGAACQRRRNYIIDDSNLFFRTQLRRTEDFRVFQRRAVFIVLPDVLQTDIFTSRVFTQSTIYEMKANLVVPQGREYIQKFEFYTRGLMSEEAAHHLLKKYIKEGREAGYIFQRSQQQHNQHQRFGGNNFHQNYHRNQHQHSGGNRHYGSGHQQGHYDMYGNRNMRYQNWGGYNVDPWMYPPVGYYNQYSSYGGNYNQMQGSASGYNQRNWNNGGQWSNTGQWGTGYQGGWNAAPGAGYGYGMMGPGNMKQQKYGGNRRGRNQNWGGGAGGGNSGKGGGGKKNQNASRNNGVQKTNGSNSNGNATVDSVSTVAETTEQQSAMQTDTSVNVTAAE